MRDGAPALKAVSRASVRTKGARWFTANVASRPGLSRDWGSCHDGCWRMRIVGNFKALPEAGAERAVVDGAGDLEQPIGTAPRPAHLLRFVHATIDQEVGCSLG